MFQPKKFVTILALFVAAGSVAACAADVPVGSCDFRGSEMSLQYCQEYQAEVEVLSTYKMACDAALGFWRDAGCPRAGILGGCQQVTQSPPLTLTNWFYGGLYRTPADVMAACAAGNPSSTYVSP